MLKKLLSYCSLMAVCMIALATAPPAFAMPLNLEQITYTNSSLDVAAVIPGVANIGGAAGLHDKPDKGHISPAGT